MTAQGSAVLTVSESKRLIAKGVAKMPVVQNNCQEGMVVIPTGSTNAYVAEELLLGKTLVKKHYMTGATLPAGVEREDLELGQEIPDIVLKDGEIDPDLDRLSVLEQLNSGDVFIKGANALNYRQGVAGILIGGFGGGGTIGAAVGHIVGRRLNFIIPVGLEKCVAQNIFEVAKVVNARRKREDNVPRMMPVKGDIVTEIEALSLLAGLEVYQMAAGGVAGAEGSVRLAFEGPEGAVEKAERVIAEIQGEPPFVEM